MALNWNKTNVPIATRQKAVYLVQQGCDPDEVAERFLIKPSTVKKYVNRYNEEKTLESKYENACKSGPVERIKKSGCNEQVRNYIVSVCDRSPTRPLKSYIDVVFDDFGIFVSKDTINRAFKYEDYRYKAITKLAFESDDMEIAEFMRLMRNTITDKGQMLFGDESHFNDKTSNPRKGRSHKSLKCMVKVSFTRGTYKFSLLLFGDWTGPIVYKVFSGSVTEDKFNSFGRYYLIDILQRYPNNHSVLIIDNITFHKNTFFKHLVLMTGCLLYFLPKYWPRGNLPEYWFGMVKQMEISKGIKGDQAVMMSIIESVEKLKNNNYSSILKQIGYI